jgi:hypothetical protein
MIWIDRPEQNYQPESDQNLEPEPEPKPAEIIGKLAAKIYLPYMSIPDTFVFVNKQKIII